MNIVNHQIAAEAERRKILDLNPANAEARAESLHVTSLRRNYRRFFVAGLGLLSMFNVRL
jgi:hypothetical protein